MYTFFAPLLLFVLKYWQTLRFICKSFQQDDEVYRIYRVLTIDKVLENTRFDGTRRERELEIKFSLLRDKVCVPNVVAWDDVEDIIGVLSYPRLLDIYVIQLYLITIPTGFVLAA